MIVDPEENRDEWRKCEFVDGGAKDVDDIRLTGLWGIALQLIEPGFAGPVLMSGITTAKVKKRRGEDRMVDMPCFRDPESEERALYTSAAGCAVILDIPELEDDEEGEAILHVLGYRTTEPATWAYLAEPLYNVGGTEEQSLKLASIMRCTPTAAWRLECKAALLASEKSRFDVLRPTAKLLPDQSTLPRTRSRMLDGARLALLPAACTGGVAVVTKFTPLHHLRTNDGQSECGCEIVSTQFPASESTYDPEDPESEQFDTTRWERKGRVVFARAWVGARIQRRFNESAARQMDRIMPEARGRHSLRATFEEIDNNPSYAVLYYACNANLASTSGYEVIVRVNPDFASRENGCPFEVRYQGATLFKRYVSGRIIIAFEHVSDDDGGGVYITHYDTTDGPGHGDYFSFLHEAGPQIEDDQYWGIGGWGWLKFNTLSAAYNGNKEGGDFCQDCPPIAKFTSCDFSVSCGGGTLKTQPGATLIDHDFGEETCFSSQITPHNSGGWYKHCDLEGASLDYGFWTFAPLSVRSLFRVMGTAAGRRHSARQPALRRGDGSA